MYKLNNTVQLVGNLDDKPVIRTTENGKHARFKIGTTDVYQDAKGDKVTETQWHNIVAWGRIAEVLAEKELEMGSEVAVEGRLVHRTYPDKEGAQKYITEVEIREILIRGGK